MTTALRRLLLVLALVSALAVGCGSSIDRDAEIQSFMDETGLPQEQAACIIDGGIDRLGESWITSQAQVSREDATILAQVYQSCVAETE